MTRVEIGFNYKGDGALGQLADILEREIEVTVDRSRIFHEAGENDLVLFAADPRFWSALGHWAVTLLRSVPAEVVSGIASAAGVTLFNKYVTTRLQSAVDKNAKEIGEISKKIDELAASIAEMQASQPIRNRDSFFFGFATGKELDRYNFPVEAEVHHGAVDGEVLALVVCIMNEKTQESPDKEWIEVCEQRIRYKHDVILQEAVKKQQDDQLNEGK